MIKGQKVGNNYRIGLNIPTSWMLQLNTMSSSSGIPVSTLVRALIAKQLMQGKMPPVEDLLPTVRPDASGDSAG